MTPLLIKFGLVRPMIAIMRYLHLQSVLHILADALRPNGNRANEVVIVPKILAAIPILDEDCPPTSWDVQRVAKTVGDVAVVFVGPPNSPPCAVIKLTSSPATRERVIQRNDHLVDLHDNTWLGEWRALIPKPLAVGYVDGYAYSVQSVVEGGEASRLLGKPAVRARIGAWGAQFTGDMVRLAGTPRVVDEALLKAWVDEPCMVVQKVLSRSRCLTATRAEQLITNLIAELRMGLANKNITTGLVHGDLMPGNILMTDDGQRVSGLVDWELSEPDGLPYLDLLFLLLTVRANIERRELGDVICALLKGKAWPAPEQALLARARQEQLGGQIDERTLLLLCWLQHVSATLSKTDRYTKHCFWLLTNVEPVVSLAGASSTPSRFRLSPSSPSASVAR